MPKNTLPVVDPFHDPNLPSLAEALSKFESIPDETPSRKARVRAAVATIGRLLSKPPAEISAQPTFLKLPGTEGVRTRESIRLSAPFARMGPAA